MASERDLAEHLLRLARDDEAAARAMLDVGAVTDAIVGFHAQQAVEKALKAVLAFHGVEIPFTTTSPGWRSGAQQKEPRCRRAWPRSTA